MSGVEQWASTVWALLRIYAEQYLTLAQQIHWPQGCEAVSTVGVTLSLSILVMLLRASYHFVRVPVRAGELGIDLSAAGLALALLVPLGYWCQMIGVLFGWDHSAHIAWPSNQDPFWLVTIPMIPATGMAAVSWLLSLVTHPVPDTGEFRRQAPAVLAVIIGVIVLTIATGFNITHTGCPIKT